MGQNTRIEWCDDTVNPWWGCVKVAPECANCYAEGTARRFGTGWGPGAERRLRVDAAVRELEAIARRSDREGRRRRVLMASMADLFEDRPDLVEPRKVVWDALHRLAGDEPRITPLLLTKRPEVMAAWADEHGWPTGCWAGTTAGTQETAARNVPHLLRVPAWVRFLSCEPLLGPLLVMPWAGSLSWVIVGGESGPKARPMHPAWARSLRDQCVTAGVPFFFKQWGEWVLRSRDDGQPFNTLASHNRDRLVAMDGTLHCTREPAGVSAQPVSMAGKHAAGRLLDGRTWDEVPV